MNERIEELAISSGIYDSLCDPYDALKNGDYYSSIKIDLEKFAELIVRECAEISEQSQWSEAKGEYYEGFNEAMIYVSNKIKQHFGVE